MPNAEEVRVVGSSFRGVEELRQARYLHEPIEPEVCSVPAQAQVQRVCRRYAQ